MLPLLMIDIYLPIFNLTKNNVVILEEPYVSEMLINYLSSSKTPVLKNYFSMRVNSSEKPLNLIGEAIFISQYDSQEKLYTVSEYALDWVISKLNNEKLNRQIRLVKDKYIFRKALQSLYPDFFFREIAYSKLSEFDISELAFPVVLKPSVGFLSTGVYILFNFEDWRKALSKIRKNFVQASEKFPDTVVGDNTFIIESYIGGREFAVDLYFHDRKAVIINIFEHLFSSKKDVSDRLYVTSKKVFDKYSVCFTEYVNQLNKTLDLNNMPVHFELRVNGSNILPIEINPLRFTGMCLNEINFHIMGKHPLEYYFSNTAPDYDSAWKGKENELFCFSIIEKPKDSSDNFRFDINSVTKLYSDILELRPIENPRLDIQTFVFSKTKDKCELDRILNLKI